jgi:hypothetical protein
VDDVQRVLHAEGVKGALQQKRVIFIIFSHEDV